MLLCRCGLQGIKKTAKKEGPNFGREFYVCPVNKCVFFLWASDNTEANQPNNQGKDEKKETKKVEKVEVLEEKSPKKNVTVRKEFVKQVKKVEEEKTSKIPKCKCKEDSQLLKVTKDGTNKGKYFWVCSQQPKCNFFMWCTLSEGECKSMFEKSKEKEAPKPKIKSSDSSEDSEKVKIVIQACGDDTLQIEKLKDSKLDVKEWMLIQCKPKNKKKNFMYEKLSKLLGHIKHYIFCKGVLN